MGKKESGGLGEKTQKGKGDCSCAAPPLPGVVSWCYTKKVDNKKKRRYNRIKRQEEKEMAGTKSPRYSEEFKKTIVNLHQNGKSYAEIEQEYGVSHSALAKWIKQYSAVRLDDNTLITAEQIKALQKRNAQLEEENLILKKAIAIFTPHSDKD